MAKAKAKPKTGRPSAYRKEYAERAYRLALLGLTDELMAETFGVAESTLHLWKQKHPAFSESITRGKADADAQVAERLYERARGFEHTETKVFQYEGEILTYDVTKVYPPDTQAASLWLRNRQPKLWRDKVDVEVEAPEGAQIVVMGINVPMPGREEK